MKMKFDPDPLLSGGAGGRPSKPSSRAGGAKGDGTFPVVGQGGGKPRHGSAEREQQDVRLITGATLPQGRNEPVSGSVATATKPRRQRVGVPSGHSWMQDVSKLKQASALAAGIHRKGTR